MVFKFLQWVLFLSVLTIEAQNFEPSSTKKQLSALSKQEQIDYINTNFYAIYSADFSYSLELSKLAITFSKELQMPAKEAVAQKNYGIILYLMGDYEKALPAYLKAYDLYDSLEDKSGLAQLSNEMANYYQKQEEYERSLELWAQAELLAKEANDLRTLGTAYGMQAAFYWLRQDYGKSDTLYAKCHSIRIQQKDSVGLGYTYLDLADIERRKGNLEQAIAYFNESTNIRQAIGDKQGVLENHKAIGDFYLQTNAFDKSLTHYQKALNESLTFGYPDLARKSLDSLSSLFAKTGDFRKSLAFKIKAENLEDSLFSIERAKVITRLQTQYETAKKEQQINLQRAELSEQQTEIERNRVLLGSAFFAFILFAVLAFMQRNQMKKKQQLKLQEAQLQKREAEINATISSQEKERTRYARDLHDGFGQMISVLNMNINNLKDGANPNKRHEVYEASSKVIDEMYGELKNICFDLMPQTLIKNGLASALQEFVERINNTGKVFIELNVFGLEKRLSEIQEISIFRISQEWVNNILKYSSAEKVILQITKDENEITLLIEDDGIGFDKSLLTVGKGNGWKNLHVRANLIKGNLELETRPNVKGNTLILNAPTVIKVDHAEKNTMKTV